MVLKALGAPFFQEDLMVLDSGRISESYGVNFPLVLPLNWELYQHLILGRQMVRGPTLKNDFPSLYQKLRT